uniref:RNA-directed RNA polymerase n=1 Tax=Erysiphales associated totivirus 12 TaxID=2719842 RepID=A0A6G9ELP9_9VIRU|nr:RNA-dependent RNA polymerase [Erysiphales associated totivirus 12]
MMWLGVGSAAVYALAVPFPRARVTAFYLPVTTHLPSKGDEVKSRLSRIEYGQELFPYGNIPNSEILRTLFSRRPRKQEAARSASAFLRRWFTGKDIIPFTKASMKHMRHVSVNELKLIGLNSLVERATDAILLVQRLYKAQAPNSTVSHDQGVTEAFAVGIILWQYLLPRETAACVSGASFWEYGNTPETWAATTKKGFSSKCKALQNTVPIDLTPFFELEVLVNRGIGELDWEAERMNRTSPNCVNLDAADIELESYNLFSQLKELGSRPQSMSWERFTTLRWSWAPTGAYHSQYAEDLVNLPESRELRTKFFMLSRLTRAELDLFRARVPEVHAWASEKVEWGKRRAIYGVDITSFTMEAHGMYGCEEVLEKLFPIGAAAESGTVHRRVKELLRSGVPYCFDYEDFNSQHTHQGMQAVLRAYKSVFAQELDPTQLESIDWVIKSISATTVHDPTGTYHSTATLMSGCRLTTFLNTVLNAVYMRVATQGRLPATLHSGDDVLAAVKTYAEVQQIKKCAKDSNIRFQTKKCTFAALAEFLRVDHLRAGGGQYLPRAVATMVHSALDNVLPKNSVEHLKALKVRADEVVERGGCSRLVTSLLSLQVDRLREEGKLVGTLNAYLQTHVARGGLNDDITKSDFNLQVLTAEEVRDAEITPEVTAIEALAPRFAGVRDYAHYIGENYLEGRYKEKIAKRAAKALTAGVTNAWVTARVVRRPCTQKDIAMASQYKKYSHIARGMGTNLAKAFGVPILNARGGDKKVVSLLRGAKDPIQALKIWF